MKTTTRHIEYLTQLHDCVTINGLGSILAHHEQARSLNGVMYAPRRVFTFNNSLTYSDGILEDSIAREKQVDLTTARQIVEEDVRTMLDSIHTEGYVSLGIVGSLHRDKVTGNLKLTSTGRPTLSTEWSWLPEVPVRDYIIKIDEDKDEEPESRDHKPEITLTRYLRPIARYAAAAVVLLIIGFAASTPIHMSDAPQLASLAPTVKAKQTSVSQPVEEEYTYVPSAKCPTIVLSYPEAQAAPTATDIAKAKADDDTKAVATAEKTPAPTDVKARQNAVKTVGNRLVDSDSYCVIIASLANIDDAMKCVAEGARKGITYAVLEQGTRFRVYAATAPTKAQAQATLNSMATKYPGAWICQR